LWQLDAILTFLLSIIGLGFATWDICYMWVSLEQTDASQKDRAYYDESLAKK
jgi:hypothetical protein